MILSELLAVIEPIEVVGSTDKEIKSLHFDSRKIGEGDLFVAQVGTAVDGHTFIDGCVAKGAAAVVLSDREYLPSPVTRNPSPVTLTKDQSAHLFARDGVIKQLIIEV